MDEVIYKFEKNRLFPFYIRIIYPYPEGEGELFIMGVKKGGKTKLRVAPPLYVHIDKKEKIESEEMRKITSGEF